MLFPSRIIAALSVFVLFTITSVGAQAQADDPNAAVTPLRLSYINGSVSFWRQGAEDWVAARVNMPLTAGDALYTGRDAEFEIQAEGRAFIRADDETQITLANQTPDFLQLKVTSGRLSLDLRTLPSAGYTIEVDTPNAAFTIEHAGYYRLDVDDEVHFITRRGGRATLIPAGGEAMTILPSEEIVVRQDTDVARAETYVAPELDDWDRWNYDRTNNLIDSVSERYLPSGIAGARDLDHYGNWRVTDNYGPVWVPDAMPSGWVPYSTGRWVWDPYYQWTWVDDAPWGWAPYHYGRWVYLGGYWAWAPGPVAIRRPVYAPALVAFFGVSSRVSVGVSFGGGGFGWVALSWGEPCVPWWGRSGFVGRPWWGGWGGPHVVNNVVVRQTTVINVTNINYANSRVSNAIIATPAGHFGRSHVREVSTRLQWQQKDLQHIRGALPVKPNATSLVADAPRGERPPEQIVSRPVVATRRPPETRLPWRTEATSPRVAEPRYVLTPKSAATNLRRPEPGTQTGKERLRPPLPQRYEEWKRRDEPAVPSAVVREREAARYIETKPTRIAPAETTSPSRGREPATSSTGSVAMPLSTQPKPQDPRIGEATRQTMRAGPPEASSPPRRGREISAPASAPIPVRVMPPEQQPQFPSRETAPLQHRAAPPATSMSSRGARESTAPSPAPMRTVPAERQSQLPRSGAATDPRQGGRQELPGVPANRTYRGGNSHGSEREQPRH